MVERLAGAGAARLDPRGMTASELALSGLPGGSPPVVEPWLGLVLAVVLVALNGFFVAAEFAIVKVRPTQIEPHARKGNLRGRVAQHLVQHLDAYLSATQLGITLASLALGWIGEPAFAWIIRPVVELIPGATANMLHSVSLTIAFLTITVLHIVLGELAPKSLAIRKAELTTLWVALPLYTFYKVTFPIIWVLNHTANGLLKLVGIAPVGEAQVTHSEDELRLLLSSEYAGKLSSQKRELLDNVFELSHRVARQIMVPRADVTYLSLAHDFEENLKIARESEYTRFPLCTEHLDEVIGLVHIKDVFRAEPAPKSLEEVKREITFVPETLPLDALLRRMRQERLHMAAVVDEYGGISGIVTLEDVIEEIVGQNPGRIRRGNTRRDGHSGRRVPRERHHAGDGLGGSARAGTVGPGRRHRGRVGAVRAGALTPGGRQSGGGYRGVRGTRSISTPNPPARGARSPRRQEGRDGSRRLGAQPSPSPPDSVCSSCANRAARAASSRSSRVLRSARKSKRSGRES